MNPSGKDAFNLRPQEVARVFLDKQVRYRDLDREDEIGKDQVNTATRVYPIRELIERCDVTRELDAMIAVDKAIIPTYPAVREALAVLAHTGELREDVFRNAEKPLTAIVKGVREEEASAKASINPGEIEEHIWFLRTLRDGYGQLVGRPAKGDEHYQISPNDIDYEQQLSLSSYALFKGIREVAEAMLLAVRQINQYVNRRPPGREERGR